MKKLLIGCVLSFLSTSLFAQLKVAPVFGIHAASTILSREIKDDLGDDVKNQPTIGITIGALGDYQLFDNLSVRSGLLISLKGGSFKFDESYGGLSYKGTEKHRFTYLELPIWVSYPIGESGFSLTGGPTFGRAVGGKAIYKWNDGGDSDKETETMEIGNSIYDDLKPFDVSINLGLAKQIDIADKTLEVSFNIQPSITKWNPESKIDSGYWSRNLVIGLRAAYFFSF
jgi:hypothetical protein